MHWKEECFEKNLFFIQVIEILDGYRYDRQGELDEAVFQLKYKLIHSFVEIRKYLDNCKKKTFKRTPLVCRDEPVEIRHSPKLKQQYSYVLDIIDTKIFEPNCVDNNTTRKKKKNIIPVIIRERSKQILIGFLYLMGLPKENICMATLSVHKQ